MNRTRNLIVSLAVVAASTVGTLPVKADMLAGWDFSQYFGDGLLSVDGSTFTNTLDSNYSDLDPTFGAGAESSAFGTMTLPNLDDVLPTAAVPGSLSSNINAPTGVPFESFTVLINEGQMFANALAMTAVNATSVIFEANLTSNPLLLGSDWSVSFGGKTFSGTSSVGVEFSTDGVSYNSFGSVNLTSVDTPFNVGLGTNASDRGFVRLTFDPTEGQPVFDNFAISAALAEVPEPGTALLLGMGLLGLARAGRQRC